MSSISCSDSLKAFDFQHCLKYNSKKLKWGFMNGIEHSINVQRKGLDCPYHRYCLTIRVPSAVCFLLQSLASVVFSVSTLQMFSVLALGWKITSKIIYYNGTNVIFTRPFTDKLLKTAVNSQPWVKLLPLPKQDYCFISLGLMSRAICNTVVIWWLGN